MGRVGTPMPAPKSAPAMGTRAKAKAKAEVAMKPMKPMKVIKVAVGKKAKVQVYKGARLKTKSGLKKEDLVKSRGNKVVSAKKSQQGKASKWAKATIQARAAKGYTGFKPIKKGTSFYDKAKELMADM